jgi:UDP-N-acetylmuramoylalanine--D-glutamate ligase
VNLILGCGVTGVSVANYFAKHHKSFSIADSRKHPPLAKHLPECQTFFGRWKRSILEHISRIIISPGIAPTEDIVQWAIEKNIPIISDIDLFYQENLHKTFIGITGSNGKSTTTKLLEFVLQKLGNKAIACGNIGLPILDIDSKKYDIFVVELSSYQLDYSNLLQLDYGVVLNITPDHLERYQTFENYIQSKLKLYTISKTKIINPACEQTKHIIGQPFIPFAVDMHATKLVGRHNIENILAVLTICKQLTYDSNKVFDSICDFTGLEHRLEFVRNVGGRDYYNDSKATNAHSTITAIKALQHTYSSIVLILGGRKKTEDYSQLITLIQQSITQVVLIGESAQFFASKISIPTVISVDVNMMLHSIDINSDCVLFSPACASFDMFENFEQRGNVFKTLVNTL